MDEASSHADPMFGEMRGLAQMIQALDKKLTSILHQQGKLMASFQDLANKVAALSTVEDSVLALLKGVSQQLKDVLAAGATPAAIQQMADDLDAQTAKLTAAVTDNTPSTPAAPATAKKKP